jgi:lipopolysaccharide transport system permease protein
MLLTIHGLFFMKPPTVIIEGDNVSLGRFTEIWRYRELLFFLAWRDVKVKYKQTALGVLWIVLQPLLTMAVFTFIFGRFIDIASGELPYALFALSGLVPWSYFSSVLTYSSNSLVNNSNLITKVYCPRMIIPLATIFAGVVDLAIVFALFLCVRMAYGFPLEWQMLLFPVSFLWLFSATVGVSFWLSALNVCYRDVRHIIPFLIQMWLFASPIVYPLSTIKSSWLYAYACNPLVGVIELFRWTMFGAAYPIDGFLVPIGISLLSCALIFFGGIVFFQKMERGFADTL